MPSIQTYALRIKGRAVKPLLHNEVPPHRLVVMLPCFPWAQV